MAFSTTPETLRLFTTTHEQFSKLLISQVGEGANYIKYMQSKGAFKLNTNGVALKFMVRKGEGSNGEWYSEGKQGIRKAEQLLQALYITPVFYRNSFTIPHQEQVLNKGPEALVQLFSTYAMACQEDSKEELNSYLLGTRGSDTTKPYGLIDVIKATGTILGIDRATDTWFASQSEDINNTFTSNGIDKMRNIVHDCQRGGNTPDLILGTQSFFENYSKYALSKVAVQSKEMQDLGWEASTWDGIPVYWDRDMTANYAFVLCTKGGDAAPIQIPIWGSAILEKGKIEDFQEGTTCFYETALNQYSKQPRCLGVLTNGDTFGS